MQNILKLLALCALAPLAANAATYNAYSDFSTTNNPNSPWSYAGGTPATPVLLAYAGSNFGPGYGFDYWAASVNDLPAVGINGTPSGSVNVPAGEVWMHPGPNAGQDSIVLFTAPTTGTYSLSDFFTHRDTGGTSGGNADGQNVGTYLNGLVLDSANLTTTYGNKHSYSVDHLFLNAGDVLAFDLNKIGTYYNDSTGFNATIASTPEPSALILVGTGMLGFAGALRRRIKA